MYKYCISCYVNFNYLGYVHSGKYFLRNIFFDKDERLIVCISESLDYDSCFYNIPFTDFEFIFFMR